MLWIQRIQSTMGTLARSSQLPEYLRRHNLRAVLEHQPGPRRPYCPFYLTRSFHKDRRDDVQQAHEKIVVYSAASQHHRRREDVPRRFGEIATLGEQLLVAWSTPLVCILDSAGWALGATLDYGQRLGTALIKVAAGERVEAYRCEFSALVDDGALYAALCGGVVWTCWGLLLRYV